ncbi:hypothetical protein ACXR0O_14645 [Verrucomicrobiota bacterium sgz303538]
MRSLLRSLHLAPFLLSLVGHHSNAQEPVPLDRAREFARSLSESAASLKDAPVHVDADVLNPVGLHADDRGVLVVPDRNLTANALNSGGSELIPVGELFLRNVGFAADGKLLPTEKLQHITVAMQDRKVEVPIYLLAAKKDTEGKLELLIFGKGSEPIVRARMGKVASKAKMPIELTAEKQGDNSGMLTLNIAGQYEAELLLQGTTDAP